VTSPVGDNRAQFQVPDIEVEGVDGQSRRIAMVFQNMLIPVMGYRENVINEYGVIFGVKGNRLVVLTPLDRAGKK
jgi:hypothetical protein